MSSFYKEGDPFKILEKELGPAVADYRNKWAKSATGSLKLEFPLHLNIELVYGCNLRCQFCILSSPELKRPYKAKPGDKISFEKYCEIIDEGAKYGLCSVALNGYNEPLIQKDIVKYISYARNAGILDVTLHTNGLLLTEELSRKLIDSGLSIIMFSIDAMTEMTYKKIRKSSEFNKLMKNIFRFLELKNESGKIMPLTRVSFFENEFNLAESKDFVSFWNDKVDFVVVQSFCDPRVREEHYKKIEGDRRFKKNPFIFCPEPYRRLLITCDGNILPCCSYYGVNLVLGNIYKDSIYKVWNSQKMLKLRSEVNSDSKNQPVACRICKVATDSLDKNKIENN